MKSSSHHRKFQALIAGGLFIVLVAIALWGSGPTRHYGGDVLVIVFLHFSVRSVMGWRRGHAILLVLVVALLIEFSQIFGLVALLSLDPYPWARIILGQTADWGDVAAYAVGALIALITDRATFRS